MQLAHGGVKQVKRIKAARETSNLVEHEANVGLLAEAAAQAAEDLQTERLVGSRVVASVDVHLDLFRVSGRHTVPGCLCFVHRPQRY